MSYRKQHELGIAGLALLRNWLVGGKAADRLIFGEIRRLFREIEKTGLKSEPVTHFNVSRGYKVWAETYDDMPNLLLEVEEPAVEKILKKLPPGKALDAACGTGRYSAILDSLGYKVTGMDLSAAMLAQAKKSRSQTIKFIKGNLESIPLKNAAVDLSICALALSHLPDVNRTFSELKRVTRPGGHIILSDIHPWLVALGGQAEFIDKSGQHGFVLNYVHWHSEYWRSFQKLGLKVIECAEPTLTVKHLQLASAGFDLQEKTVAVALENLPIALIWVLKR